MASLSDTWDTLRLSGVGSMSHTAGARLNISSKASNGQFTGASGCILRLAGTESYKRHKVWHIWGCFFTLAFSSVSVYVIVSNVEYIQHGTTATMLNALGWVLIAFWVMLHWVFLVRLRSQSPSSDSVDLRGISGIACAGLFLEQVGGYMPWVAGLINPAWGVEQYVSPISLNLLWFVFDIMTTLVHYSTALLLLHQCEVLRIQVLRIRGSDDIDIHNATREEVLRVRSNWACFLVLHLMLGFMACTLFFFGGWAVKGSGLRKFYGWSSNFTSLSWALCMVLVHLYPLFKYNCAVEQQKRLAADYSGLRRFEAQPLYLKFMGIKVGKTFLRTIVIASLGAVGSQVVQRIMQFLEY